MAQQKSELKRLTKSHEIWVKKNDGTVEKAFLKDLLDESILLSDFKGGQEAKIAIGDIRQCQFRKKNAPAKGMIIGLFTGVALGASLGYLAGNDNCRDNQDVCFPKYFTSIVGGIVGIAPGVVAGATIGTLKINIRIKGQQSRYEQARYRMAKYKL